MQTFVSGVLLVLSGLAAIPVAIFVLEISAAIILPPRKRSTTGSSLNCHQRIAVLIPAHNEGRGLLATLDDVRTQIGTADRLLVVADNCTDDTAAVATMAGAEVVNRSDREKIGKGYALDFGIAHLGKAPPDIVVVVDADCRVEKGAIEKLTSLCAATHRPVQALDLVQSPPNTTIDYCVAEFAWRVKNWVRPLGLNALNLPCQLMGTGMAFPWDIIQTAHLANGWLVEDLKLGLDLTLASAPPVFCSSARITSEFAPTATGAKTQRQRWEQGHLYMILAVPRLIFTAVRSRNVGLLALALDLSVPPLSLLVSLLSGILIVSASWALLGFSAWPLITNLIAIIGLTFAIFLCWFKFGRDILPANRMFLMMRYLVQKLPHYGRILFGKTDAKWIRTDRK
ncbi:MAG: glycosyltransferase family 2 protein [Methylovirgula sp.]